MLFEERYEKQENTPEEAEFNENEQEETEILIMRHEKSKKPLTEDDEAIILSRRNESVFLDIIRRGFILCFLKANSTSHGQAIIDSLYSIFTDANLKNNESINIVIKYKLEAGSFKVIATAASAYCFFKDDEDMSQRLKDRLKNITPNTGSGSEINIPIWKDTDDELVEAVGKYFISDEAIDEAVNRIIRGSFSFNKKGKLFYTPFHVEALHEFLHVVSNSTGTNREKAKLADQEAKVWDTGEEYWVIKGTKNSENALNKEAKLPSRWGHYGIPAYSIINFATSPDAQISLKEKLSPSKNI